MWMLDVPGCAWMWMWRLEDGNVGTGWQACCSHTLFRTLFFFLLRRIEEDRIGRERAHRCVSLGEQRVGREKDAAAKLPMQDSNGAN